MVGFNIKLDLPIDKVLLKTASKYGPLYIAIKCFIQIFYREISIFFFPREFHEELVVGGKSTYPRLDSPKESGHF